MMSKLIGVTIGDIDGIGIILLIDSWKKKKLRNFILFTNINIFKNFLKKRKIKLEINKVNYNNELKYDKLCFNVFDFNAKNKYENILKSIDYSYKENLKKSIIGFVTLPLRKDLIKNRLDKDFMGHTEYLEKLDKANGSNMILYNKKITVSTLTTHISVKSISRTLSKKNYIYDKIYNLSNTLKTDFNIKKPKIAISGFNPHCGENGTIGDEEKKIIIPQVKKIRKMGINIQGPISADSMLINLRKKNYDCYVFIFHDQALIPFKYISNFSGVNYTGNLKVIRTSPDHGTAYNLIYSKNLSSKSLINSFKLIKNIYNNRINYEESKKIIRSKLSN